MISLKEVGLFVSVDQVEREESRMSETECPHSDFKVEPAGKMPCPAIQCPHCGEIIQLSSPPSLPADPLPPVLPAQHAVPYAVQSLGRAVPDNAGPASIRQPTTSWMAVLSLILALLSIPACCCAPLSIAAVVCGHIGLSDIRRSAGSLRGDDLCIAGLIIGYVAILLWAIISIGIGGLSACGAFAR